MLRVTMETIARMKAHIQLWFYCPPSVSLSVTVTPSNGDFTQGVDRMKALIACHVFFAAGKSVAGDSVAYVIAWYFTLGDVDSNGV